MKYIADAFNELYQKLQKGQGEFEGADPENKDEYLAFNVFFVPETARCKYLQDRAKQPEIGKFVDDAMDAIEKQNPSLKGVLPKEYAQPYLNKQRLGSQLFFNTMIPACLWFLSRNPTRTGDPAWSPHSDDSSHLPNAGSHVGQPALAPKPRKMTEYLLPKKWTF